MGSGYWLKSIIGLRKAKRDRSKKVKVNNTQDSADSFWHNQGYCFFFLICSFTSVRQVHSAIEKANESKESPPTNGESSSFAHGDLQSNHAVPGLSAEYIAAVRIQKAFRAYKVHFSSVIIEGPFISSPMNQTFCQEKKKI